MVMSQGLAAQLSGDRLVVNPTARANTIRDRNANAWENFTQPTNAITPAALCHSIPTQSWHVRSRHTSKFKIKSRNLRRRTPGGETLGTITLQQRGARRT